MQMDAQYGISLDEFTKSFDPRKQFQILKALSSMAPLSTRADINSLRDNVARYKADATAYSNSFIAATEIQVWSPIKNPFAVRNKTPTQAVKAVQHQHIYHSCDDVIPIVIDTGASMSLTPINRLKVLDGAFPSDQCCWYRNCGMDDMRSLWRHSDAANGGLLCS